MLPFNVTHLSVAYGVALLQGGQPDKEVNYAQIEKELLVIVFVCEKFDAYIYGCDCVRVQTDHKPLESIFQASSEDAA